MSETEQIMADAADKLDLATALTVAWLGNAHTRAGADDATALLTSMHGVLAELDAPPAAAPPAAPAAAEHRPAVSVRRSLASPDHVVSMIDGRPYRTLARHLKANGLTPDEYRARYVLKPDYPMVAPGFSAARSEMSKRLGLGRKKVAPAEEAPAPAKGARRKRSPAAARDAARAHLSGGGTDAGE